MTVTPRGVVISPALKAQIASFAGAALPDECCGLLIGSGDEVVIVDRIVAAANIAENARRRFLVDPQVQFDTLRALRDTPSRIVGHYHSHPDGPAAPSVTDLEMALDSEAVWVIVAIDAADTVQLGAFVRPAERSAFERITLS